MTRSPNEAPRSASTSVTGRGDPMVLLPGGLTGWTSWEPHAERLAQHRQVVRTQLLAVEMGLRDEALPSGYGVRTETDAVRLAMDELELGPADVVGWSYGGLIALDLALAEPERVRSLTLIEPVAFWSLRARGLLGPDAKAFEEEMRVLAAADVTEAQLARFLLGAGVVPGGADPRDHPRWPVWVQHRNSLRTGDVPLRHEEDLARLRTLDRPALLFVGEGSPRYLRDIVGVLHEELPRSRVEELPGGHALPLVSIDAFLRILSDFVDELDG